MSACRGAGARWHSALYWRQFPAYARRPEHFLKLKNNTRTGTTATDRLRTIYWTTRSGRYASHRVSIFLDSILLMHHFLGAFLTKLISIAGHPTSATNAILRQRRTFTVAATGNGVGMHDGQGYNRTAPARIQVPQNPFGSRRARLDRGYGHLSLQLTESS